MKPDLPEHGVQYRSQIEYYRSQVFALVLLYGFAIDLRQYLIDFAVVKFTGKDADIQMMGIIHPLLRSDVS